MEQHPEVDFNRCKSYCRGMRDGRHCEHYEGAFSSDNIEERIGSLEDIDEMQGVSKWKSQVIN